MSSSSSYPLARLLPVLGGAAGGILVTLLWQKLAKKQANKNDRDPETDPSTAHKLVWNSISGAMNAAMLYTGDHLKLYKSLADLCAASPGSSVTAIELAQETGLHQRWLREWMAQQAGMGILKLLPGTGDDDASLRYRLPAATADVLANPDSKEYDIAMVQMVPALVNRAKSMLPEAFSTGLGRPYDEPDVAEAIDRHHVKHVRDFLIPTVLPMAMNGSILDKLEKGCTVGDLGCGAGIVLVSLAKRFPKSTFHGFEISTVALEKASYNVAAAKLSNVFLHDANTAGEQLKDRPGQFDLVVVFDVLHDSTHPMDLIKQVKVSLKKDTGVWVLGDIPSRPTIRENLREYGASIYFGFSVCLCMSSSCSVEGGAGLGTLGFSIPTAKKMLGEGGFDKVDVLWENSDARWFLAR